MNNEVKDVLLGVSDGHAAYEAHTQNADGERVTVYVNEQFEVVGVEPGR